MGSTNFRQRSDQRELRHIGMVTVIFMLFSFILMAMLLENSFFDKRFFVECQNIGVDHIVQCLKIGKNEGYGMEDGGMLYEDLSTYQFTNVIQIACSHIQTYSSIEQHASKFEKRMQR